MRKKTKMSIVDQTAISASKNPGLEVMQIFEFCNRKFLWFLNALTIVGFGLALGLAVAGNIQASTGIIFVIVFLRIADYIAMYILSRDLGIDLYHGESRWGDDS